MITLRDMMEGTSVKEIFDWKVKKSLNKTEYEGVLKQYMHPNEVQGTLGSDKQERKDTPICSGVLDYFPLALAAVARLSKIGNDQHNPGEEMHWARGKSTDHADCIIRHLVDRGRIDTDGESHTTKVAWRALALLQEEEELRIAKELGVEQKEVSSRASRW